MSPQQELISFLTHKIKDQGITCENELTEETPLLTSRLISSLTLLELAIWIEERMATPIDLKTIDPVKEWDTIRDILGFIKRHSVDNTV